MKKNNIFIAILFVLYGLLPVFDGLMHLFGCEVTLISYEYVALGLAVISVALTALLVFSKDKKAGKCFKVLAALMPIVHMLNWLAYAYHGRAIGMMIPMTASFVCSVAVSAAYCDKAIVKIVTVVLALAMLIPVFIIEPVTAVEDGTLLEAAYAPNGRFIAEVLLYGDPGEDGSSAVKLYDNKVDADLWLFEVKSLTKVIYEGTWDDGMDMQIHWTNVGTLMIDDQEYIFE